MSHYKSKTLGNVSSIAEGGEKGPAEASCFTGVATERSFATTHPGWVKMIRLRGVQTRNCHSQETMSKYAINDLLPATPPDLCSCPGMLPRCSRCRPPVSDNGDPGRKRFGDRVDSYQPTRETQSEEHMS